MVSAKAILGNLVGGLLFREARVDDVRDLGPRFRLIEASGEALRGVAFEPGDKIQVHLPDAGMRTYTPIAWDAERGATSLLVYMHGPSLAHSQVRPQGAAREASPGASWAREIKTGDRFRFFGPRRSLALGGAQEPALLFGDETSFAVAAALVDKGRGQVRACIFEATEVDEARRVLAELGVACAEVVPREPGGGHLLDISDKLTIARKEAPNATVLFTGKAQSIQVVQRRVRECPKLLKSKTKAYWATGKRGLD